jgi:hypothetical protein
MRNVTITLPDELAGRARVEAAKQDKSLSRFIADLLAERYGSDAGKVDKLAVLWEFLDGPGYPGISKAWQGRETLYAEREEELLRRYESSHLRNRSGRSQETAAGEGFSETDNQLPYAGSEPAKPQRTLSRRRGKTRPRSET